MLETPTVPFHRPDIGEPEIAAVEACLRSGWLTTGSRCREFEEQFAGYVGAQYAVAVNSCTAALHLALEAIGIGPGDAVAVPTMTFTATAEVAQHVGARPVLVDVDPKTLNIDLEDLERRRQEYGRDLKAVIPVHLAGLPCDEDALQEFAERTRLTIVEDAAHALPASYGGKRIGSFNHATAFSFYATKNLTTGEGGMLTTHDPKIASRARCMSLHGISRDAWKRYMGTGSWRYEVLAAGFKYNLTDLAAALGLVQLSRCEAMRDRRASIAAAYSRAFSQIDCLETPEAGSGEMQHAWHLYTLRLRLERLAIDRDQFIEELKAAGVSTSVHFIPLHLHPHYQSLGYRPGDFPAAEAAFSRMISLPLFSAMTETEIARVIDTVHELCDRYSRS